MHRHLAVFGPCSRCVGKKQLVEQCTMWPWCARVCESDVQGTRMYSVPLCCSVAIVVWAMTDVEGGFAATQLVGRIATVMEARGAAEWIEDKCTSVCVCSPSSVVALSHRLRADTHMQSRTGWYSVHGFLSPSAPSILFSRHVRPAPRLLPGTGRQGTGQELPGHDVMLPTVIKPAAELSRHGSVRS